MSTARLKTTLHRAGIFTAHELDVLLTYKDGVSITAIAKKLGSSPPTTTRWIKELGIYKRKHKYERAHTGGGKCERCGILLKYDPGTETLCGDCCARAASKAVDSRFADAALVAVEEFVERMATGRVK